jgi:PKD repeat protein
MDSITPVSADDYTIAFSGVTDGDQYILTVGTGIQDTCTNPLSSATVIIITIIACSDTVPGAPSVTSTNQTYVGSTTSSTYSLTFSEDVTGVDTSNVTWTPITGTGTMDSITQVTATTYTVAFSGASDGDQYTLSMGSGIEDGCLNPLTVSNITISIGICADPVIGPPTVTSSNFMYSYTITASTYNLTFSETVTGVNTSNVTWTPVTGTGVMDSITGSDSSYTISFSGVTYGDQYTIAVGTGVEDSCSNPLASTVYITITIALPTGVYPFSEDFETFTGIGGTADEPDGQNGWTSSPLLGYEWRVDIGTTTSSSTGPNVDHTTGTATGVYVYTEASAGLVGDTTLVETPFIDLTGATSPILSFWYHMYGTNTDHLDIQINDGSGYVDLVTITGEQQTANADLWYQEIIDLSSYLGDLVTIRFVGTRGASYYCDMAIDDVEVREPIVPITEFVSDKNIIVVNEIVAFTDLSSEAPTSWLWSFAGPGPVTYENGTTSTDQDVDVSFSTAGLYTATLQATNSVGPDTEAKTDYIEVLDAYFWESFETMTGTGSSADTPNGQKGWTATPITGYQWLVENGPTISTGTGPSGDHTTGSGVYVYTEASSGTTGALAFLATPSIDLASATNPALSFWYHMYGVTIDNLEIQVDSGSGYMAVWTITGQQHTLDTDPWTEVVIDLTAYAGSTINIRWIGTRGTSFTCDMAIDDILVEE